MGPATLAWLARQRGNAPMGWLECPRCGLIRSAGDRSPAQIREWYGTAPLPAPAGAGIRAPWKRWCLRQLVLATVHRDWRRWPWVLPLYPLLAHFQGLPAPRAAGRVLDLGCGEGECMAILRACGWSVQGVEMDPRRAAIARAHGVPVWSGEITEYPWDGRPFDVIRLWHVLEHLPEPDRILRHIRPWLKPGGELIVGVPNVQGAMHHLFRRRWAGLRQPYHLHHFTARAMDRLLRGAGFSQIRIRSRSCGTVLDSFGEAFGTRGRWAARQLPVRLASVLCDGLFDLLLLSDALDARAAVTAP